MRGGIDPGDLRFRPRIIPVVDVWNNFGSGDGNVSPRGTVGPRRWAEGRLPPRAGYMSPSQSGITNGVGVSKPRGAVPTPATSVFVLGLLEL